MCRIKWYMIWCRWHTNSKNWKYFWRISYWKNFWIEPIYQHNTYGSTTHSPNIVNINFIWFVCRFSAYILYNVNLLWIELFLVYSQTVPKSNIKTEIVFTNIDIVVAYCSCVLLNGCTMSNTSSRNTFYIVVLRALYRTGHY